MKDGADRDPAAAASAALPSRPVERLLEPVHRFLRVEAASGIVLLACTAVALAAANSRFADTFAAFWETPVVLAVGSFRIAGTIGHLVINDGLMTIFFFVAGLEIKRELVSGELADRRKARLPVVAALGGMVVPAAVYLALQWGEEGQRGWAIPMATDIAFVVGFLALFGSRVPMGLKTVLLALAIADDLGAVLIIALVFTADLAWGWLGAAGAGFAVTYLLNRVGVRSVRTYLVVGAFIWLAFLGSGVHPTVAGVLLGLLTPASAWVGDRTLAEVVAGLWQGELRLGGEPETRLARLEPLRFAAREAVSPLNRLESNLHPWVAFGIMPLFALANAGVPLEPAALESPVARAVAAGLALGKPAGILLASVLAVRLGWTELPDGVSWRRFAGGACLAGIGFTMALFLNTLAFSGPSDAGLEAAGKVGTLAGSVVSAAFGAVVLLTASRGREEQPSG
jgi:NhaA family Na+:H+ antiporter